MQTTNTLVDGTKQSAIPVSPSCPQNAVEMLPVLKELVSRQAKNGESFQFTRGGNNALALLRKELKRRLNLLATDKLPEELNKAAMDAVDMFSKSLLSSMLDDGYQITNIRKGVSFVKFDKDLNIKADGLANTARAEREFRNDGERLAGYQIARAQLLKRQASMLEQPGKYERHEIAAVEAKVAKLQAVIQTIVENAKSAK